jgi:Methylamine utilisation protein MauE
VIVDMSGFTFIVGSVGRLVMAFIFAMAALHNMRDWTTYTAILRDYKILPRPAATFAACVFPPLSLVTAVILVIPAATLVGAGVGLAQMNVFTLAILINLLRGRIYIDCGCGGSKGQRLSIGLIVRNLVLVALLVAALLSPTRGSIDVAVVVSVVGASLAATAFYFASNQLITNLQELKATGYRRLL